MPQIDTEYVRSQFPALARTIAGHPAAYLDGPGGTQVPHRVIDAMRDYLVTSNSNIHGLFATTEETDAMIAGAREAMGDFFGCGPEEVAFGANMTTLTFLLAQAIGRELRPGDEILITEIDHEANRGPWLHLAERGVLVREVPVHTSTCTLDWDAFETMVKPGHTKVIAVNYASNAVGTINDVARVAQLARDAGAISVIDAVHYALHGPIDVKAIGCDFLLCSAYKFFGPHIGVVYARRPVLEALRTLMLSTQEPVPPFKLETGTLNHEGIAGAAAAVEFIADLGDHHEDLVADVVPSGLDGRRRAIVAGMLASEAHEQPIARRLVEELADLEGVTVYGPPAGHPRTSTVSFTLDGMRASDVCRVLGARGLFLWDGDFYAHRLVERLGLLDRGGLVRAGLAPYNTMEEAERLIAAVAELALTARGARL
jgi:cysteine desulfurase family protein (TIGR01976 family)